MRDARFVGLAANGEALIVEHDGEHLRLPLDRQVRAALAGDPQMPMPLEAHVSPRDVQHRIRCGESAADIATSSGVAVELIARFEGPVLDERRWHAEQARRATVDGTPLAERLAAVTAGAVDAEIDPVWDARLADDGEWRVVATLPDGRTAEWGWDPRTRRIRGRNDLARLAVSGDIARDDLEAVLRPVAAARRAQQVRQPAGGAILDPEAGIWPDYAIEQPAAVAPQPAVAPPTAVGRPETGLPADAEEMAQGSVPPEPDVVGGDATSRRAAPRKRRAQVPSWDEIIGSSPRSQGRNPN